MEDNGLDAFLQHPELTSRMERLRQMGVEIPSTIRDLQLDASLPFMRWLVQETTAGFEAKLPENDPPGILVSTHRDIVCDPAMYNLARVEAGRPTTHIVLGTNLAGRAWVRELMARNKALFIDRSLRGRAALVQQQRLSEDICRIVQDGGHVWIAQAPGRAKDGVDQTHAGLLRMLGLAWGGEEQGASALHDVLRPLAIRYDINPCDALLLKESLTGAKSEEDDERSMGTGIMGWKGVVRLEEGEGIPLEGLTGKESWAVAAQRVDEAMKQLQVQGVWAETAKRAWGTDIPETSNSEYLQRWKDSLAQLDAWGISYQETDAWNQFAEIYREVWVSSR